jgi:hypothetical protein
MRSRHPVRGQCNANSLKNDTIILFFYVTLVRREVEPVPHFDENNHT